LQHRREQALAAALGVEFLERDAPRKALEDEGERQDDVVDVDVSIGAGSRSLWRPS
jgi:hypothetical protein